MKKSILNTAVTMAMTSALLSGAVLNTWAYAGEPATPEPVLPANDINNDIADESYMFPGMGIGAATGVIIAGPVGMLVGGIFGAFVGSKQEVTAGTDELSDENSLLITTNDNNVYKESGSLSGTPQVYDIEESIYASITEQKIDSKNIHLAQLGPMGTVVDNSIPTTKDKLLEALTSDLSLDVYFRSGSTDIESFYPARLVAIANLMTTMQELEIYLDGYTDRRGNRSQNIALANERIEKVRRQLIDAGVEEHRINSKAFGEMKMVSVAGDLEGYNFDRKVVIRFQRSAPDSIHAMTTALSELEQDEASASIKHESLEPVVAEATTRF